MVTEQQILVGSHPWECIGKSVPRLLQDIFSEVLRIMWYFQLHSVEQVHDWPLTFIQITPLQALIYPKAHSLHASFYSYLILFFIVS